MKEIKVNVSNLKLHTEVMFILVLLLLPLSVKNTELEALALQKEFFSNLAELESCPITSSLISTSSIEIHTGAKASETLGRLLTFKKEISGSLKKVQNDFNASLNAYRIAKKKFKENHSFFKDSLVKSKNFRDKNVIYLNSLIEHKIIYLKVNSNNKKTLNRQQLRKKNEIALNKTKLKDLEETLTIIKDSVKYFMKGIKDDDPMREKVVKKLAKSVRSANAIEFESILHLGKQPLFSRETAHKMLEALNKLKSKLENEIVETKNILERINKGHSFIERNLRELQVSFTQDIKNTNQETVKVSHFIEIWKTKIDFFIKLLARNRKHVTMYKDWWNKEKEEFETTQKYFKGIVSNTLKVYDMIKDNYENFKEYIKKRDSK